MGVLALVHPGHAHDTVADMFSHQPWWMLVAVGVVAAAWLARRLVGGLSKH
jgi:Na+-translocating ferredoxin:NAD+ oxidoreductase RnfD subunit